MVTATEDGSALDAGTYFAEFHGEKIVAELRKEGFLRRWYRLDPSEGKARAISKDAIRNALPVSVAQEHGNKH